MDAIEAHMQAYVIRLWREATRCGAVTPWRLSITHVPSGDRHYLRSLSDIEPFIRAHIETPPPADASPPA